MRHWYAPLVVWVCAAVFVVIGLVFTIAPSLPFVPLGLSVPSGAATTELRAVYGGMELAVGVFLAICAWRRGPAVGYGLLLSVLLFSALASFRALGMAIEGPQAPIMGALLAAESAGALFAASGLVSLRRLEISSS